MSSSETSKKAKKRKLISRLYNNFTRYRQVVVVNLENVGSNQVQEVRHALRRAKKGEMVVGKNTVVKKAITSRIEQPDPNHPDYEERKGLWSALPQLEKLMTLCKGKVGLIFSDAPIYEIKPIIEANKVATAAKVGNIAPIDVGIPPGPTGLDPSQIAFFHALSISTKIQKGQIEITKDVKVCTKGKKVGNSEATLLAKLNIKPFLYGMELKYVYDDGSILTPEIFNITPDEILNKFRSGVANLAALSLSLGLPNDLSVPHMILNGFKNLAAIGLETGYKFKELESLTSGGSAPSQAAPAKAEEKKAAPKEEPKKEEEADVGLGGDLFGDF
jgi:large subunit ribosomal protein LP0